MTGDEFAALFGPARFELRFDVAGRAAVRVAGGPVAPRHVEPVPPAGGWVIEARCGDAAGWLLADAAPANPARAARLLEHFVAREAALRLQAAGRQASAMGAELLERITHRLRTDVSTLSAVADGAIAGLFDASDLDGLPEELGRTTREALRRLSGVREVMTVLDPESRREAEPIVATLRAELDAAGRDATVRVTGPEGETPLTLIPGAGWGACARRLAADERFAVFAVGPDSGGWNVTTTTSGIPVNWTERSVGDLAHAGHIVAAAGGSAVVTDPFGIALVLPAAPPSG
ncbi:hypothetical protein OM076_11895 [Solirubrobacter ginsenosidimutans]|uniref:Uncharacterized protein n=1 Tax=Solirubrobacter ginsenosidimutans TaxID=490573 RepID=A0A9X3MTI3_9ACTN|nr:hypothetical protein [Solirubrobacter ginsenosidimutans]MDA0160970.1 hypothetical protein [Solirubrobacter ginsenosidimutans]